MYQTVNLKLLATEEQAKELEQTLTEFNKALQYAKQLLSQNKKARRDDLCAGPCRLSYSHASLALRLARRNNTTSHSIPQNRQTLNIKNNIASIKTTTSRLRIPFEPPANTPLEALQNFHTASITKQHNSWWLNLVLWLPQTQNQPHPGNGKNGKSEFQVRMSETPSPLFSSLSLFPHTPNSLLLLYTPLPPTRKETFNENCYWYSTYSNLINDTVTASVRDIAVNIATTIYGAAFRTWMSEKGEDSPVRVTVRDGSSDGGNGSGDPVCGVVGNMGYDQLASNMPAQAWPVLATLPLAAPPVVVNLTVNITPPPEAPQNEKPTSEEQKAAMYDYEIADAIDNEAGNDLAVDPDLLADIKRLYRAAKGARLENLKAKRNAHIVRRLNAVINDIGREALTDYLTQYLADFSNVNRMSRWSLGLFLSTWLPKRLSSCPQCRQPEAEAEEQETTEARQREEPQESGSVEGEEAASDTPRKFALLDKIIRGPVGEYMPPSSDASTGFYSPKTGILESDPQQSPPPDTEQGGQEAQTEPGAEPPAEQKTAISVEAMSKISSIISSLPTPQQKVDIEVVKRKLLQMWLLDIGQEGMPVKWQSEWNSQISQPEFQSNLNRLFELLIRAKRRGRLNLSVAWLFQGKPTPNWLRMLNGNYDWALDAESPQEEQDEELAREEAMAREALEMRWKIAFSEVRERLAAIGLEREADEIISSNLQNAEKYKALVRLLKSRGN